MKATSMPVWRLAALALCGACSCTLAAQSAPPATTQPTEQQQSPFVFKTSSRLGVRDNTTGAIGTADTKVAVLAGPPQKTKE